ncbi:MAG TPA: methyltransferase domain-containing protein [Acidimicrobiales bacterium]
MPDDVIAAHYQRLGPIYNALLEYSPEFVRRLTTRMIEKLRLEPDDLLVDLGTGTGLYSVDILRQVPLRQPVVGVDPSEAMLAHIPDDAHITPVVDDALSFSARPGTYDKVLIKEAIHHVDERGELFGNLYQRLRPSGVLLLVQVPPRVRYPLFRAALERCTSWHADPDELTRLLEKSGFEVDRDSVEYRHTLPTEAYHDMVRNRYMSVLSTFSDEELRAGLDEMARTHAGTSQLSFVDHFDYLTAVKPAARAA